MLDVQSSHHKPNTSRRLFLCLATLIVPVVAIALLLTAASRVVNASASTPKGYALAEITVTDPEAYKQYLAAVSPVVARFGGKYIVRAGKTFSLEGAPPSGRIVIIEFESLAAAKRFEESPEYKAIAPLRQRAATSRLFLVEGAAE